jgi:hypothetical protein
MARPKHIRQHHAFPGDVGASLSDGAAIAGNQDSVGELRMVPALVRLSAR